MATWAYLNHDRCKLPSLEDCQKIGAKTGSIVKCGDSVPGCGRLWVLLLEKGEWVEAISVDHYVPTLNYVPIDGVEPEKILQRRKRRTVTQGQVEDAQYRLELKIAATVALERHTLEERGEQAYAFGERMDMLDLDS